jgi:Zn-dependent protease with chaperone function
MTVALFGYAAVLGVAGPWGMRRSRWTSGAPRLAIFAWFSLAASVLVMPPMGFRGGIGGLVGICADALGARYGSSGWLVGGVGLALMGYPLVAVTFSAMVGGLRVRRERRAHLTLLSLTARRDHRLGVWVVRGDGASAHCLPGAGGTIVVTSGALRTVDAAGLCAVLAHERSHLDGHHHVIVNGANVLGRVIPALPLFGTLAAEVSRLVELRADDVAASHVPRRTVANTLLAFAETTAAPRPALAVAGGDTVHRVERLLTSPPRPTRLGFFGIAGVNMLAIAVPVIIAVVPMLTIGYMACCAA